jgi:hypothetical protein
MVFLSGGATDLTGQMFAKYALTYDTALANGTKRSSRAAGQVWFFITTVMRFR